MNTWVLIIILNSASNAAAGITIPDLVSYQECVRVEKVIKDGPIGHEYRWTNNTVSQCVEVHNK